nr:unnamed protein product [Callosobruchus analis]
MQNKIACRIRVPHINVRSLRNKIDEVEAFIEDENISVLIVTEHWLNKQEIDYVQLKGFKLSAFSTRDQHCGGGTLIFIKDSLEVSAEFLTVHLLGVLTPF